MPVIAIATPLGVAYVDGEFCSELTQQPVYWAIWNKTHWPFGGAGTTPETCYRAPARVRVCTSSTSCSPEFLYEGRDILVDWPMDDRFPDARIAVARFIHEGLPQTVTVRGWLFVSDGATCTSGGVGTFRENPPAAVRELGIVLQTTCGPNIDVTFKTVEFGELHGSFVWQGEDLHYDVETGAFAQTPSPSPGPSPTPTASPTVSPAALPDAGGPPEQDRSWGAGLLAGLGALAVGVVAVAFAVGRRLHREAESRRR